MPRYRDAGVDLAAAEAVVERIAPGVTGTWNEDVIGAFGGFAAGIRVPRGYERPVLMLSTDGVGTKAEIARQTGVLSGLGHDLVAMCVDDLAAVGARPIALTDYLAVGRIDVDRVGALVASITDACERAGVALLGGETAEHPGVMDPDAFDLAGTALGVVEEGSEITGAAIVAGDTIVGVASPNLRSNGFSLIRTAVLPRIALTDVLPGTEATVATALLEPSVIYSPAVMNVIDRVDVHGLAHVTGGGMAGNLIRVLPSGVRAIIDAGAWSRPPVYEAIASLASIDMTEMFTTFNMGVGFIAVLRPGEVQTAIESFATDGHRAWEIGRIAAGERGVTLHGTDAPEPRDDPSPGVRA